MERSEVAANYRWKTEDIFENDEAWEKAFASLEGKEDFSAYRGTLNSAENLLAYFKAEEGVEKELMRVYLYAFLKHDEDVRVTKYGGYMAKVMSFLTRLNASTAFVTPELTALPEETLRALAGDARLKDYDYMLTRLIAEKKYVLSEREEALLAKAGEPMSVASDVFEMLDNAELNLPSIEVDGKEQQLSHGLYSVIMSGADGALRKKAFGLYYSAYRKILATLATTYYGNVKKDIFYQTARGYSSCLQMALFREDVDELVYRNLLSAVEEHAPLMHRYMELRKRALGGGELHVYDLHVPLVENAELRLSFEEAFDLVKEGLAPLGKEYVALLQKGQDEGWIDVCETEGKRSGAYSIGIYGIHPYVLLNYQKTTHDVFTIAHEMGHALHSYFSNGTQPYSKSDYKIFVAEVASTVNEVLLLKHLKATTKDAQLKKYLLNYFLDMVRTTLFRQTQFAAFEERAHAMAEGGEPLNKDNLSALYYELNKQYYGSAVTHDRDIEIEWARIPHFYRSFYVYKYATGITAAIAIAERILKEGEPAVRDYFAFLSGGCSTDPVSLLKIAGVDLTDKRTFLAAMAEFEETLKEFETLC